MSGPAISPSRLSPEDELYWLALRLVPGLGNRKVTQLLAHYSSPQLLFRASVSELESRGVSPGVARSIASGCTFEDAAAQQALAARHGAEIITFHDPRYPALLKDILDPPPLLFARGDTSLMNYPSVAMIGTRKPTAYGQAVSERLAGDLAAEGLNIISGMARGIDSMCHQAALAAGGRTTAIFGCGVDLVYPSENRKLYTEIATRGLLISEFPMGAPAYPQNFPIRNRIVSGMSCGIVVVEGAQYSGSSITARLAIEQGRDVYCVPGNITSALSFGPNLLIRQGAKLISSAQDVLLELSPENRRRIQMTLPASKRNEPQQSQLALGSNQDLSLKIMDRLRVDQPTHIDDLLQSLEDYSSSEILPALFELELLSSIRQLPGKQFVKVW